MRLVAISVSGFRSLENASVRPLHPVSALVGRNNAGKTSLLESLLLLSTLPFEGSSIDALRACLPWSDVGAVLGNSRSGMDESRDITLELTFCPEREDMASIFGKWQDKKEMPRLSYSFAIAGVGEKGPSDKMTPLKGVAELNGDRITLFEIADATNVGDVYEYASVDQMGAKLSGVATTPTKDRQLFGSGVLVSNVVKGTSPSISYLRPVLDWTRRLRFLGRLRRAASSVGVADSELFSSDGSNLARFLQDLLNNSPLRWQELKGIYQRIIPSLVDVFLPIENASTSARIAVRSDQDAQAAYALECMGAGTTHLVTIIAMVWSTPSGGTCLIEEPEQGLHASAQRELAIWLKNHALAEGKQVILATHSPIFARPGDHVSVHLATYARATGTDFKEISLDSAPVVNEELGVRLIDFYLSDVLFIVEAETEEVTLPILARALGIDFKQHGIRLFPLSGTSAGRLSRLREFLKYVRDTQVIPFIVLDDDDGVRDALADLVGKGQLDESHYRIWERADGKPGEFEDNFSDAQLIEAANDWAAESESTAGPLVVADLEKRRKDKPNLKTSKALAGIFHERHNYGLNKPTVARRLALMAAKDIEEGKRDYQFVGVLEDVRKIAIAKTVGKTPA